MKIIFKKEDYTEFYVCGDISGTNTNLAILGYTKEFNLKIILKESYRSKEIAKLHPLINEILTKAYYQMGIEVSKGCFAVAGIEDKKNGTIKATNNQLLISKDEILTNTALSKVELLNDFEAIGFGIPFLSEEQYTKLNSIEPKLNATKAIIGAGTGLGTSILTYRKALDTYQPSGSEGGHIDFAATDEIEWRLHNYIKKTITKGIQPSNETIVSGPGLVNIFNFLKEELYPQTNEVTTKIDSLRKKDKPKAIAEHAKNSEICAKAFEMFLEQYAKAARNLAITTLAQGGLYIAGGIAMKNLSQFKKPYFMQTFTKNYKHGDLLRKIPVFIITDYDVSLYGCANAIMHHEHFY